MKLAALIVENRFDVTDIIQDHKKFLPEDFDIIHIKDLSIKTEQDYNRLMTSVDFWKDLPYDKVLIFQHDSKLLRTGIEAFYEYDYVGAPWKFQHHGGNGGLSLRSVPTMVEILNAFTYDSRCPNEDVWFCNILNQVKHFKLAPRDVCSKFSCESIFELGSLGYHAINRYLTPEQCNQIKNQYVSV